MPPAGARGPRRQVGQALRGDHPAVAERLAVRDRVFGLPARSRVQAPSLSLTERALVRAGRRPLAARSDRRRHVLLARHEHRRVAARGEPAGERRSDDVLDVDACELSAAADPDRELADQPIRPELGGPHGDAQREPARARPRRDPQPPARAACSDDAGPAGISVEPRELLGQRPVRAPAATLAAESTAMNATWLSSRPPRSIIGAPKISRYGPTGPSR